MLIVGDAGSGKTDLLKLIAGAVEETQDAHKVQYGVITDHPEEWEDLGSPASQVGIFPTYGTGAEEFVESLDEWAHSNHGERQSVLLLIDDLSAILNMGDEARHSLRWLLLRGPARRVWPIVTTNPRQVPAIHPWISFFHTRLFGRIANLRELGDLAGGSTPRLETLGGGSEFMMREGNDWLKFWIPGI
jgi:energy-coupling factor transporter ATP-binding protein EcfA2